MTHSRPFDVLDAELGPTKIRGRVTRENLVWHDMREWGVEGKGWQDTERYFDRLPARAEGAIRAIREKFLWELSRHSAGMSVRFATDAGYMAARWTLLSPRLAMPHMAASGVSGLDLYVLGADRAWRWLAATKPDQWPTVEQVLFDDVAPSPRTFMLYLPLYNGVESLEIGIPRDASFKSIAPRAEAPIVFYGTSITQGACASRPGMCHTAILGRRLDRPTINLGFSGNGKMDPEVVDLLAELDPCVYVIDCLPNTTPADVAARTEPLVHRLRQAHADTPILLVEDRTYSDAYLRQLRRTKNVDSRLEFRKAHDRLLAAGVRGLHYVPGEHLFGDDDGDITDLTVDGSHPTDMGYYRIAAALEPALRQAMSWRPGAHARRSKGRHHAKTAVDPTGELPVGRKRCFGKPPVVGGV